jgi:hypothetical protein
MVNRFLLWSLTAFLIGAGAERAIACPACVLTAGPTVAQQLIGAESVLLVASGKGNIETVARIKGPASELPRDALRLATDVATAGTLLVAQDKESKQWRVVGSVGAEHAPWLRRVAASRGTAAMTEVDWRDHVAFYLPYLEHAEPLLAETAYTEIARSPYEAMRTLKPALNANQIEGWLDDPRLSARGSLYTLMLGVAGGARATDRIDRQVTAAQRQRDVMNLPALLVADLELRGLARLDWIEKAYLTDKGRSPQEVQAALLALQVQGGADAAVPRERIVQSYRTFIRSRHPLAGYPAPVLLSWQAWDAVPDYVALLTSKAPQHPASAIAMLNYLDSSPRPEGKAAVAAYRASGR